MSRWTCPACDREFGRAHQSHVCVPGCTVDECFEPWPPAWREIYDVLFAHLETLGPVHADAVRVGVFLKSDRKLAEVRPKARSLSLELVLPRAVDHPRISRRIRGSGGQTVHVIKLTSVTGVDDQLTGWLTEAYDAATA
jgi:hypothetical protein